MPDTITRVLKAIADPTRRELFHALVLAATALPITQLATQFTMSRQGITKHLRVLEDAGLIAIQTVGRERYCSAQPQELATVKKWLSFYDTFWDTAIQDLGNYLDNKV